MSRITLSGAQCSMATHVIIICINPILNVTICIVLTLGVTSNFQFWILIRNPIVSSDDKVSNWYKLDGVTIPRYFSIKAGFMRGSFSSTHKFPTGETRRTGNEHKRDVK